MAENRFHELLGLPEDVTDPDYYQLLGVERSVTDASAIEAKFKAQMTRAQHIENPRHKEFVEFLKGELKRARGILTDAGRRAEYDRELTEERGEELRKILGHMLVEGTLSSIAEVSVFREGHNLGLTPEFVKQVVDEELQKAGARRVATASGANGHQTQMLMNQKAQEVARQVQEARMAARLAETRAKIAETDKRRAEQQVQGLSEKAREAAQRAKLAELEKEKAKQTAMAVAEKARQAANRAQIAETEKKRAEQTVQRVQQKARQAQEQARQAINREHMLAMRTQMSEAARRKLEEQFTEAEARLQAYVEASQEELESAKQDGVKWQRLTGAYAAIAVALVGGAALPKFAPAAADAIHRVLDPHLSRAGNIPHAVIPLALLALVLLPVHLLAGRRSTGFYAPLLAAIACAALAGMSRQA